MPRNRHVPLVQRTGLDGPYALLTFRHPEVAREAQPGQFVMIKAGLSAEPPLRRPFSVLSTDPERDSFTLFVKAVGPGSHELSALPLGGLAQCLGPLGRPFSPPRAGEQALMVAGGYGIAPFLLMSRTLASAQQPGRVFYGGRGAGDVLLRQPFEALGVPLEVATEDGSLGFRGRVTEALARYLDGGPRPARLYACGPDAMLHAVARLAEERALPCQVSLDPWMGCGLGTCLGCVVFIQRGDEQRPRYRCACTEGPVFEARQVVWHGESESQARREALHAARR